MNTPLVQLLPTLPISYLIYATLLYSQIIVSSTFIYNKKKLYI